MSERTPPAPVTRRNFLAAAGGAVGLSLVETCCPGGAAEKLGTHHVPEDKNLDPAWVKSLFERGASKTYRGDELTCIGMPVGGICAGQLYLRGDGTLALWEIFNTEQNTGYGDRCYRTYTPPSPLAQGFAVWAKSRGSQWYLSLDKDACDCDFIGEYPIGRVRYSMRNPGGLQPIPLPLDVTLEAFAPFVPLNAKESGIPGTVLRFHLHNRSDQPMEVNLGGWLQNAVCAHDAGRVRGRGRNAVVRSAGLTTLLLDAEEAPAAARGEVRPPEVFANFESGTYGDWKKTGTAFGDHPATGTLPGQQHVSGFGGKYLVNTFAGGDATTGTLTSPEFMLRRPYVAFRIGGGHHPGKACINLVVGRKVVRTATGKDNEKLEWDFWDVSDLHGQKATIEIVDRETTGWGHINIDDIQFADEPPRDAPRRALKDQPDFGTLALSVFDGGATGSTDSFGQFQHFGQLDKAPSPFTFPLGQDHVGGLATRCTLQPGQTKEAVFLLTWHFPNAEHGRRYAHWFRDAVEVAAYLRDHLDRLSKLTHLFHDTYYDSTLPHWLLDRLMMPVSTLATNTVQWWRNGRFWAWEGVGCCTGTCTHVWNYAQAPARLFPEVERSARVMQDLGVGFDPQTGRVAFRGEAPGFPYAADGQCGTVLKCYREHLMSKDGTFLKEHWPRIKKVMEFLIRHDGNADGVIEDQQPNTYDINFVGPNAFVGALYLAALEAAARMADVQGDRDFAGRCRALAEHGRQWSVKNLWNGAYFIQRILPGQPTRFQYGDGCLADQLLGQNWADQVDLGYVYPADQVRTALKSVYRYNWAPDVAAQNQAHPPQRWFARPGEAGLFICTWPRDHRMKEPVLYRDEVWTGTEYEVAACLLHEGMLREGLSIIRGIHDRYDGRHHNPWNEVECGDHYARAMASWGCLLALCGFVYDGPAGRLGFAPRFRPEDFRAFFAAAEGWGTLRQKRAAGKQENAVAVKHGKVSVRELVLEAPEGATVKEVRATLAGQALPAELAAVGAGRRVVVGLKEPAVIEAGRELSVTLAW